jgi:transposase
MSIAARTEQLSDEAWALIEPLLPSSAGCRGGQWRDHRQVLEAILWRYRTGSPWRDLPVEFGPWQTIWKRLNRWSGDGTLDKLLAAAHGDAEIAGELEWVVSVDSTIARAHQHAAGARKIDPEVSEAPIRDTGGRTELQETGRASAVRRAG